MSCSVYSALKAVNLRHFHTIQKNGQFSSTSIYSVLKVVNYRHFHTIQRNSQFRSTSIHEVDSFSFCEENMAKYAEYH